MLPGCTSNISPHSKNEPEKQPFSVIFRNSPWKIGNHCLDFIRNHLKFQTTLNSVQTAYVLALCTRLLVSEWLVYEKALETHLMVLIWCLICLNIPGSDIQALFSLTLPDIWRHNLHMSYMMLCKIKYVFSDSIYAPNLFPWFPFPLPFRNSSRGEIWFNRSSTYFWAHWESETTSLTGPQP